jgi:ribosomal subunit interface protein
MIMQKRIVYRGMEKTDHMEQYCNQQLAKIEHFLVHERTPIMIDLVLEPSHVHSHHKIELRVNTPHYHKISMYEGPEFYEVFNRVIDNMYFQLHEEDKKVREHRNQLNRHEEVKKAR